jgi:TolB-like protein/DNA-binding winged helix-turn-helix (wHTH) protein/tetratricopeptide (TPR) repeat protein
MDLRSGELRTNGISVRLQPQPAKVLAFLVRRRGETVTRTEIVEAVWGSDTFVDYEQGLNFAIRQIRSALGDDAERPVYVETIPKRGYRFVAPVIGAADASLTIPQIPPGVSRGWQGPAFKIAAGAILLAAMSLLTIPASRHWLMGRGSSRPIQSLAVLPFENLSGDSSKDYFADGFTDELTTDLAEETKIRVVSRTSVLRYKGTRRSLPEIAKELKVDAIVEGSVSLSDQKVRITAQLIQASSDRHLWAHSYERDRKDLFPIQSEVAATIAGLIRANTETSSSNNVRAAPSRPRFTAATYELSLVCRNLWKTGTDESVSHAIQCYQHILTLDPTSAVAHSELAYCYLAVDPSKARDSAIRAIDLDPSLAEAHLVLADFELYESDLLGAEKEFEEALALNPSSAQAHVDHANVLLATGQTEQAVAEARTARELDPFSSTSAMFAGRVFFMAGLDDPALEAEMAVLDLDPHNSRAHYWMGYAYEQKGMYKDAIAEYEKAPPEDDGHGQGLAALGRSFLLAGESKKAAEIRRKIEHFPGNGVYPYDAAMFYAVLGDNDRAFQSLERDLKQKDGWLLFLNVDPRLVPLRSDPRFQGLVKRVGLPIAATN